MESKDHDDNFVRAQDDLNLCILRMLEGTFLTDADCLTSCSFEHDRTIFTLNILTP